MSPRVRRARSSEAATESAEAAAVAGWDKPTGPVAAVMIAAGIGALVLGILVIIAESSESFANSLAYSDRVGPLSGKTIWAVVAFLGSWGGLTVAFRNRDISLTVALAIMVVLLALAYLATFSPFFELFAPEE